jgi:hypothetical protein
VWATVPLDRQRQKANSGAWPRQGTGENSMNTQTEISQPITPSRLKEIKAELAKMKPAKVTLDGNRSLTVKETISALAPTLERMKKRGFDTQEIAENSMRKALM